MITDERTSTFIDSISGLNTPFLEELEVKAHADGIPIIRRATQSLIKFVLADLKPASILEIGTATGFSAIFMATYGGNVHIDTIENYKKRITEAKQNIADAGLEEVINLIEGDAESVIEELAAKGKSYDMIFIDAAKAQYLNYLPVCKNLLRTGGILISDNVLFDGDIVLSRFAVRRRDRTIHARMREYLRTIAEDDDLVTTILPIADGMTLSVRCR
ncbi:MAG: O-methyltransferase [Lachnospiraceae bacterium]|nr:O-methyltransferase [Lachnospiraceae bacterium]MBR1451165.1 O-methyltransferase [Lachnospiraceae bacterium]